MKLKLGLPKPKPTPYNLRLTDQTTTKLLGLIIDLKIYVHGILYITTFDVLQNNVVDSNYSILLGRPWLRDAKVEHDWGSNIVTIQRNGTVRTITITKHLGGEVRKPKVLLCYDYQNGITDEKNNIIFVIEPRLFSIRTISPPKTIQYVKTTNVEIMGTYVHTSILELKFRVHNTKKR